MISYFVLVYCILIIIQYMCVMELYSEVNSMKKDVSTRNALLIVLFTIIPLSICILDEVFFTRMFSKLPKEKSKIQKHKWIKRLKLYFLKRFKISYCHRCLSINLHDSYWTRGHDIQYGGAIGCRGLRCYDCGYIEWSESLYKYKLHSNPKYFKVYDDDPLHHDGYDLSPAKPKLIDLNINIF